MDTDTLKHEDALASGYFIGGDRPAFTVKSTQYVTDSGYHHVPGTSLTYSYGTALVTVTVCGWYDLYLPDGTYVFGWNGSGQSGHAALSQAHHLARLYFRGLVDGARRQRRA